MKKTVPQFFKLLSRYLLAASILAALAACGGASSETPPGGANNQLPDFDSPLIINLGDDLIFDSDEEVKVSAGYTTATRLEWTQIGNGPQVTLVNSDQFQVRFLPPNFSVSTPNESRRISLRLTGWDDQGNTAYDDIDIIFPPRGLSAPVNNTPPTIQAIANVIAQPGETVELTANASDAEDGVPQIQWSQRSGPRLSLTSSELNSPTISFVVPNTSEKIWFIVSAIDSAGAKTSTYAIIEVMGNIPPTANAGGDMVAVSGQLITVNGNGSDRDGNITSYLWQQVVDGAPIVSLQNSTTSRVSFIAPDVVTPTDITLQLTVTDDLGASATDEVVISVNPSLGNIPPTAYAGPDQVANLGDTVILSGSGNDADGNVASFLWTQVDGPTVTLTGANTEVVSFSMPANMQGQPAVTLQLIVTDDQGAVGSDEVVVTANLPPIANAGVDQILQPGDTVNLLSSGSSDEDGNIVSYLWTQIGGTPSVTINRNSANPSFTAPNTIGNLTFELAVTDDYGAVGRDTVVISIVSNVPPTANAGPDLAVNSGDTTPVSITGNGFDNDGNITSFIWTQIAGPSVTLNGADTATVSFNVPVVQQQSIITLRLTVIDDGGATGSDDVRITVNAPLTNNSPVANAGANQTVNAGDSVTLSGLGTDPDGDPLTYSWRQTNGPAITLESANTPNASFTAPEVAAVTNITIELTVTDDKGASGTDQIIITVEPTNTPPTVDVGADFAVLSGNQVSITGTAIDQGGQIDQYTWTRISGPGVALNNANTATVNFIAPTVNQSTQLHLRLTVVDNQGATAFDDVIVTINPASGGNTVPVVNAGPDVNAVAGNNVSITGTVTDDGQIITYIWTQMSGSPSLSLSTPATPTVSFIAPNVGSVTTFTLRLTAVDDAAAIGFDEVIITVTPAAGSANNSAPTADAGPTPLSVTAGETVSITGSGNDSDGSIASYQWTQRSGINVVLSNTNTDTVTFVAPSVSASSNITLRLTVTDNLGATGFDDVIITVNPVSPNSAPIANAGPDVSVNAGQSITLSGSGSDQDGAIASYSWSRVSGQVVTLNNTTNATLQFTAPAVTQQVTTTLRLTVTDNLGATGSDDVVITINPAASNIPPTANAGPNLTVTSGNSVSINGSGNDPDGSISNYLWSQVNGVSLSLSSIINPTVQFIAPPVQSQSTATLRLTVTDNLGATAFDDVVVTINPAASNQPPIANAGTDQSVNIQDFVTLAGSGSDADGTVVSFRWAQIAGLAVTLNNINTANASFSAPVVNAATELTFELTVTDNSGNSAVDTQRVTVYPLTTLSGSITTQSGTQVDRDVNDTSAPYTANNTVQTAQPLNNPVVLGGYVNLPGQGPVGRSRTAGDVDDYFSITLSANQVISLYIGDVAGTANDLDLYLLDQAGQMVDASASPSAATETLTVPTPGNYIINVKAVSGASNYVLSVGVGSLSVASNGWRLSDDFEPGDIIVQFTENGGSNLAPQALTSRAASVGLQAKAGAPGRNMLLGLGTASQRVTAMATLGLENATASVSVPPGLQSKLDTLLATKTLAKRADVTEAGLNYRYYPTAVPNDTNYNLQWHYPAINLPQAWDITTGSSNVIVAVIDTGVLLNHPDLQGQLVAGYDFIADNTNSGDGEPGIDSNPNDPGDGGGGTASSFHGTHVSGTIAAASNNGVGVAGIAWGVKIMPCRAVGINGGLRYDIEQCVRYVSGLPNDSGTVPAQRADIINLSLGGPTNTTTAPTAYRLARDAGVIVVAAAGNDSSNGLFAPAAYDGVVSVSATNISRQLASYSNFGSTIDVAAPGGDSGDLNADGFFDGVLSTGGDDSNGPVVFNYRFAAGTSMASPHMAGVAALMKSVYPGLTPAIFDSMLANGELTDDLGSPGRDNSFGYGLINAQKAVTAAVNAGNPAPPPPPAAVLQLSPTSINLGIALTSAQFTVSNAGGGTLSVTNITNDSSGWLSVTPASVDASGLGSYTITIDRNGLLDGVYTATITVTSSAGTQTAAVIMQVNSAATADYAGFHYIELIDAATMQLFDRVISNGSNGVYDFTFPGVPLGMYHIRAGSDLDKDGVLCEVGDSCGAFPTMDIISQHVMVDGSTTNLNGLDFSTGFSVNLTVP
ncbi:PKD domain-containing protein [Kaarinaea lacus]